MISSKIRLGVIGGGTNSAVGRAHLSALSLDRLFQPTVGYFSRQPEINLESGEYWGVDEVHNNLDEFVSGSKDSVDAFLILSPTPRHKDHIFALSGLGLPIICEKALASSVEDGNAIAEHLKKLEVSSFITFNYTGYPMVREIQNRIRVGKYGKIHTIDIQMLQEGYVGLLPNNKPRKVQDWRLVDYELPTVSLDLGVHVLNMVEFLTGSTFNEFLAVQFHAGRVSNAIDSVISISTLESNAFVNMKYGKSYLGKRNAFEFTLFGDEGSVNWRQEWPNEFREADRYGEERTITHSSTNLLEASDSRYARFKSGHPVGFIEAFSNIYLDIYEALRTNKRNDYVFPAEVARLGLLQLATMNCSAQDKEWKNVTDTISDFLGV
jgi:predicted dehydrogenase